MILFLKVFFFFLLVEVLYLKIAKWFNVTDNPNQRSSHSKATITGAGLIFPLAFLLPLLVTGEFIHYRAILTGLFLVTCISFLDDLKTLNKASRVIVQILAVSLLLWQTGGLFNMTLWALIPGFIFVVGIINAYNFMDGINGMTALYSLTVIGTIFFLSKNGFERLPVTEVFVSLIAALLAFSYFNVRKMARTFCGDVGSISIAFIISFLIIQLMIFTDNGKWILLIGVYGLDAVATIFLRLIRGENIGQPHRTHFYQFLVADGKMQHVIVSLIYAAIQLILNVIVVTCNDKTIVTCYVSLIILYMVSRLRMEGKERLFIKYL